jgi:hypothetical protein
MAFWNIKFESSGTLEWDVEADTLDEAELTAEQNLRDEVGYDRCNDYDSYSSTLVDEDGKPLGKEVFVGGSQSLKALAWDKLYGKVQQIEEGVEISKLACRLRRDMNRIMEEVTTD